MRLLLRLFWGFMMAKQQAFTSLNIYSTGFGFLLVLQAAPFEDEACETISLFEQW